jgi:hypothetical protein
MRAVSVIASPGSEAGVNSAKQSRTEAAGFVMDRRGGESCLAMTVRRVYPAAA